MSEMTVNATVHIFRKRDPKDSEQVASYVFTDMAKWAAYTLCERYRWDTEVRYTDISIKPVRFTMGKKAVDSVVEKGSLDE